MRGDKHRGSKCPDCGERVVFMKREDGKSTPPLHPPEVKGGVWRPHVCAFAAPVGVIGRTRMQRLLDGCAEHVIRRVGKVSFNAFVRKTGKVVSTGALDSACAKKLRTLRDELSGGA